MALTVNSGWKRPSKARHSDGPVGIVFIKFQWSPDGKTLAVARAENTSDVVLLREK
jgi:hypothetical protein